jgi:hypothetical protein
MHRHSEQFEQRYVEFDLLCLQIDTAFRISIREIGELQWAGNRALNTLNLQHAIEKAADPRNGPTRPGLRIQHPCECADEQHREGQQAETNPTPRMSRHRSGPMMM